MCAEKPSRSFLDGKRKCLKDSRFKISFNPELAKADRIDMGDLNVLEECMAENLKLEKTVNRKPWRQKDPSSWSQTKIHRENDLVQDRLNAILSNSYRPVPSVAAAQMMSSDPEIKAWTDVTVQLSNDFKVAPKMSFPVLVRNNNNNGDEQAIKMRTKRWGTGQMAAIGALTDDNPITGPPTYLEVYKKSTHVVVREPLTGTPTAKK